MVLFIILGAVVLGAFGVLSFLFFWLNKEGQKDEAEKKRLRGIEDQLRTVTLKADKESNEARNRIEGLTKENASLKSRLESTSAKVILLEDQISRANTTVSELKGEKEALLSASKPGPDEALRRELEALKYELVKARAQSSGLERVNINYKNQLEDLKARAQSKQGPDQSIP